MYTGLKRAVLERNLNTTLYWDLLDFNLQYRVLLYIASDYVAH